jgi:hypothetical protein
MKSTEQRHNQTRKPSFSAGGGDFDGTMERYGTRI